ncbi:MAG: hypothetical protein PUD54_00180, partial [Veillonellaceae bacterium]|nr:hypothetical protein [Veillonellaceae bacterium]
SVITDAAPEVMAEFFLPRYCKPKDCLCYMLICGIMFWCTMVKNGKAVLLHGIPNTNIIQEVI